MSLTLYRKYRPHQWAQVIGQEHLTVALTNEIATDALAHAYLLSGPRGVGKTTVARLLAKSINCTQRAPGTAEPCGACLMCTDLAAGRAVDVLEIDAASHTGVDNVREHIIENAQFTPTQAKYKVFIIDEVHMLTPSAFNALLKTLEEPPSHVVFVLATTELHKVPATIASRCERFLFKRVPVQKITEALYRVAESEGVTLTERVAERIATHAEGSLRDAQSALGQLIALGEKNITEDVAALFLPQTHTHEAIAWLTSVMRGDAQGALQRLSALVESGTDVEAFYDEVLRAARAALTLKAANCTPDGYLVGEEDETLLRGLVASITLAHALRALEVLLRRRAQLHAAPLPQMALELAAIELCGDAPAPLPVAKTAGANEEIARAAESLRAIVAKEGARDGVPKKDALRASRAPSKKNEKQPSDVGAVAAVTQNESPRGAETPSLAAVREKWDEFVVHLSDYHHALPLILKTAEPSALKALTLTIRVPYQFHAARLEDIKMKALLERALASFFGAPLRIEGVHEPASPNRGEPAVNVEPPHAPDAPSGAVGDLIAVLGGRVIE